MVKNTAIRSLNYSDKSNVYKICFAINKDELFAAVSGCSQISNEVDDTEASCAALHIKSYTGRKKGQKAPGSSLMACDNSKFFPVNTITPVDLAEVQAFDLSQCTSV